MNRNAVLIAGCAIAGALLATRWYLTTPVDPADVSTDAPAAASEGTTPGASGSPPGREGAGATTAAGDDTTGSAAAATGTPAANHGAAATAGGAVPPERAIGGDRWPSTDAGADAAFVPGTRDPDDEPLDPAAAHAAFVDGIRVGFDDARTAFTTCYEAVLEERPAAVDRLVFELHATTSLDDPELAELSLQSITAGDLALEELECFVDVVEKLIVPAPPPSPDGDESPMTIRYPVQLSPDAPADP